MSTGRAREYSNAVQHPREQPLHPVTRLNTDTLPYVLGESTLRNIGGRPVWPVMDEAELEALRSTVALFDGRLEMVGPTALVDGEGMRPSLAMKNGASILYPDERLRPLAELYAHLTSRVAKHSPLDRVGRAKPEIVVCLWEHLNLHVLEALQRAALRRPLGLIVAETAAALRVRLLRCAAVAALAPPAGGELVVSRSAMTDAWSSQRSLDPGGLRARSVLLLMCFGVPSSDSLVPPEHSLLEAVLANPEVACVATSLGAAMASESDATAMGDALRSGFRVGDALYRNPGLAREAQERCHLLLFGDPRTRPFRGAPRSPVVSRASPPLRRPLRPEAWSRGARRRFVDELLAIEGSDDETIVERLDGLAPLWPHWMKAFQPPRPTRDPASCPGCGRLGRSFTAEWREAGILRVFSMCTRCGIFRDVEPGSALDRHPPRLRGALVEIPDEVAGARVLIELKDEHEVSLRWVLPPGRGREQPIDRGAGLATLNVLYLQDLEMAAWQLPVAMRPPSS